MEYVKNGQKRDEFWMRQDLANDPAGQKQASEIARGAMFRIAIGKMTKDEKLIKVLMTLWKGEKPSNEEPVPVIDILMFFEHGLPPTLTEKEKELLTEFRIRVDL